jgi:hypothetical protein
VASGIPGVDPAEAAVTYHVGWRLAISAVLLALLATGDYFWGSRLPAIGQPLEGTTEALIWAAVLCAVIIAGVWLWRVPRSSRAVAIGLSSGFCGLLVIFGLWDRYVGGWGQVPVQETSEVHAWATAGVGVLLAGCGLLVARGLPWPRTGRQAEAALPAAFCLVAVATALAMWWSSTIVLADRVAAAEPQLTAVAKCVLANQPNCRKYTLHVAPVLGRITGPVVDAYFHQVWLVKNGPPNPGYTMSTDFGLLYSPSASDAVGASLCLRHLVGPWYEFAAGISSAASGSGLVCPSGYQYAPNY